MRLCLDGSILEEVETCWFLCWVSLVYLLKGLNFEEDNKWSQDFLLGSIEGTC